MEKHGFPDHCACSSEEICLVNQGVECRAKSPWIQFYEQAPADGQNVAFVTEWSHVMPEVSRRVLGGRYRAGKFGGFCVPGMTLKATHWMPLPDAPTGDSE